MLLQLFLMSGGRSRNKWQDTREGNAHCGCLGSAVKSRVGLAGRLLRGAGPGMVQYWRAASCCARACACSAAACREAWSMSGPRMVFSTISECWLAIPMKFSQASI